MPPSKLPEDHTTFNSFIDELVRLAPCPTMVVQCQSLPDDWSLKRILVPTNGTVAARNAVELGFLLASFGKGEVNLLHVVSSPQTDYHGPPVIHQDVIQELLTKSWNLSKN